MSLWIGKLIERASWQSFALWLAVWIGFNVWAFRAGGPWVRALSDGGGTLPETQLGFPPIEPQRSIAALGNNTENYLLWQAVDIPYAILNMMVAATAIALALHILDKQKSFLRMFLILPPAYFIFEVLENTLVSAFASGALAPSEPVVLVQQAATSLKLLTGTSSIALGLISVLTALTVMAIQFVRK